MAHNFTFPQTKEEYKAVKEHDHFDKYWKDDSLFQFDDKNNKILLHGVFRDFSGTTARRRLRDLLGIKDIKIEEAIEKYATEAYKKKIVDDREKARKLIRPVAPPSGPTVPPPNISKDKNAQDATADLLSGGKGMVLGYDHKDQGSKDMMRDLVKQGKVKHLFIEEFTVEIQADVDKYLSSPSGEISQALKLYLDEKKEKADFTPLLIACREKGVKIHGIDSSQADPGVDSDDPRYHERRLVMMNAVAKEVFDKVRKQYPTDSFVAMTGMEHVNTADGGIPGLSQIMSVPGVTYDSSSGKIMPRPEDTSKRGIPTELEQAFVDQCTIQAQKDYATALGEFKKSKEFTDAKPQPSTDAAFDGVEIMVVIQAIARKLVKDKKLTDSKSIKGLLTDPYVKKTLAEAFKKNFTRSHRKAAVKKAVDSGDVKALEAALMEDPSLINMPYEESEGQSLLHAASKGGQSGIVMKLLEKGANPNAVNLKGDTPLHVALATQPATDKKNSFVDTVGNLLKGGAKHDVPNNKGKTGLDLAKDGPAGGGKMVAQFVKEKKASLEDLFVSQFIEDTRKAYDAAKKPPRLPIDETEVRQAATSFFKKLDKTDLTSPTAISEAVGSDKAIAEINRLVKVTGERFAQKEKIPDLIKANNIVELSKLLKQDPVLARTEIEEKMPLTIAALNGKFDIVDELIKNHGVNIDQLDSKGRTTLYTLCSQEIGKEDTKKQKVVADSVKTMLEKGANVNSQNPIGETPLHQAGFRNNVELIKVLASKKADSTIKDKRGWTAHDMTLGSTNKEAEQTFYDQNLANKKPPLVDTKDPNAKVLTSTIDILCQATLCNVPGQEAEVRKSFETLYADPSLRPMLDLAAASACNPRNPPKGGLRIFVSDRNTVGALFGQSVGPSGAYDEKVNSLLIPMATDTKEKDPIGTLAHELTHLCAHLVSDDEETMPFEDEKEKQEYLKAIEDDVKKLHLLDGGSEIEKFVRDRFGDRMNQYADRGGDKQLLQEYLVGVPQLASVYGMEYVEKLMPNLTKYYKKFAARCTEVMETDDRFKNGRERISKQANGDMAKRLENEGAKPPKLTVKQKLDYEQFVKTDSGFLLDKGDSSAEKVKGMLDKIRTDYTVKHGKKKAMTGRTISFQSADFELSPEDSKALEKKLAQVEKVLISEFAKGKLPAKVSAEGIRKLIGDFSDLCHSEDEKKLPDAMKDRANNWIKNEKIGLVDFKIAMNSDPTAEELAEAIVYRAQAEAHGDGDRIAMGTTVNESKQKDLVKQLTQTLGKKDFEAQLKNPKKLIANMSQALSNDDSKSVYLKDDSADHVSINKRKTKRIWLRKLKSIRA